MQIMIWTLLTLAALYAAIRFGAEWLTRIESRKLHSTHWSEYELPFWRRSPLPVRGPMMRRRVNGQWEYRVMTDKEAADRMSIMAW